MALLGARNSTQGTYRVAVEKEIELGGVNIESRHGLGRPDVKALTRELTTSRLVSG